jgi:hypothetical protein
VTTAITLLKIAEIRKLDFMSAPPINCQTPFFLTLRLYSNTFKAEMTSLVKRKRNGIRTPSFVKILCSVYAYAAACVSGMSALCHKQTSN